MGKIRTRTLGLEDVEEKQKKAQKEKSKEKKASVVKAEPVEKKSESVGKPVKKITPKKQEAKLRKTNVRGKKYTAAKMKIEKGKIYKLIDAVKLLSIIKYAKFDESVELHLNVLEVGLKGEVDFPHTTGKSIRISIVSDAVLSEIEKGKMNFDLLVTHPSFMPRLAKFAKVLGPKGLMPNPKAGTISTSPQEVAAKFKKGLTRWKTEVKFPLIHQMIGKISLDEKKLVENAEAFLSSVGKAKIISAYIKTTFSPSVRLDIEKV